MTLPKPSWWIAWATTRPPRSRARGGRAAASDAGSIGSPASARVAPSARWAATGAKRSRPWKVAERGSSRNGERESSTASVAPPSRSSARESSPLSGPTRKRPSSAAAATARRADPTPGSTTARWTPGGHRGRALARAIAPLPDVLPSDPVGEVDQRRVGGDLGDHRPADAGELVLVAVVGEKGDRPPLSHGRIQSRRRELVGDAHLQSVGVGVAIAVLRPELHDREAPLLLESLEGERLERQLQVSGHVLGECQRLPLQVAAPSRPGIGVAAGGQLEPLVQPLRFGCARRCTRTARG